MQRKIIKKLYALILITVCFCSFAFAWTNCYWVGTLDGIDITLWPTGICNGAMFQADCQLQCGGGTGNYCPSPFTTWTFSKIDPTTCNPTFWKQGTACALSNFNAGCGLNSQALSFCYTPSSGPFPFNPGYYQVIFGVYRGMDCNSGLIASKSMYLYYSVFAQWSIVNKPCS